MRYVLAFSKDSKDRFLCSISYSFIGFNTTGEMIFESFEAVEAFKQKWANHFYKLETLEVLEYKK